MSDKSTISSGSCTPDSLRGFQRELDSNSTPSPSGKHSPFVNPDLLSGKLALVEASESLAHAAETLSIAAQAMSAAAKSLAVASASLSEGGSLQPAHILSDYYHTTSNDGAEWQQPSYHFPNISAPTDSSDRQEFKARTSGDNSTHLSSKKAGIRLFDCNGSPTNDTLRLPPVDVFQRHTLAYSTGKNNSTTPTDSYASSTGGQAIEEQKKAQADVKIDSQDIPEVSTSTCELLSMFATMPVEDYGITSTSIQKTATAITKPAADTPSHESPSYVLLDTGFDEIPALCFLSPLRSKTICFYRYWGSVFVVGTCLRKSTNQSVIIPGSLKPGKLLEAAKLFETSSSGILLWPSHIKLTIAGDLGLDPNAQIIHLGKPSGTSADTKCSQVIVILTRAELTELSPPEREGFLNCHSLNENTATCNDQTKQSPLNLARGVTRGSLVKDVTARGFYTAWLSYHRTNNPSWSPNELVKRANRYAEESLLRGDSSTSSTLVGGRIPLTAQLAKSWKLELAVQSGELLVA